MSSSSFPPDIFSTNGSRTAAPDAGDSAARNSFANGVPVKSATGLSLLSFGSSDAAAGTVVILFDDSMSEEEITSRCQFLQGDFPLLVPSQPVANIMAAESDATALVKALKERRAKRLSLIAFGTSAAAAIQTAIEEREIIRRLMLVNPVLRGPVTFRERVLKTIERVVPMGLPTYSLPNVYDTRPFIHRLRCPTWLVRTNERHAKPQRFEIRVPNARVIDHHGPALGRNGILDAAFLRVVREFLEVPAKRSQKGLNDSGN